MELSYANPSFSQLARVLTKIALEGGESSCVPSTGVPQGNTPIAAVCWIV